LLGIHFIESSTEPGSVVGSTGGGSIAYFIQDRTVVNMDGLINSPEYFEALQNGQAGKFLDQMGLKYVFGTQYVLIESDPYRQMLSGRLGESVTSPDTFVLYHYHPVP
jgi:hypothetical protein